MGERPNARFNYPPMVLLLSFLDVRSIALRANLISFRDGLSHCSARHTPAAPQQVSIAQTYPPSQSAVSLQDWRSAQDPS